jgi:hypothetical protein
MSLITHTRSISCLLNHFAALQISGSELIQILLPWFQVDNLSLEGRVCQAVAAACRMPMLPADRGTLQALGLEFVRRCSAGPSATDSKKLLAAKLAEAVINEAGLSLWAFPDATEAQLQVRCSVAPAAQVRTYNYSADFFVAYSLRYKI